MSSKEISVQALPKYGCFTTLCHQKKQASFKPRKPKAHRSQAGAVYACNKSICGHSEDFCLAVSHSVCKERYSKSQAECKKIPTPSHLITNLA